MWEVFFLGTARRTESQRSERRDGILRAIETGCRNPLVAMGVIGKKRTSPGNWRDSERSERDMVAGAKGRRRSAIVIMGFRYEKKGKKNSGLKSRLVCERGYHQITNEAKAKVGSFLVEIR